MRLAFLATVLLSFSASTPAFGQTVTTRGTAVPVMLASAGAPARAVRAPRAPAQLFARLDVGITPDWPSDETEFADYAAQEIEAGTVSGDLYVRWFAFGPHAQSFTVDVAIDGRPFTAAATVGATIAGDEHGVHLLGLEPGLYQIRVREADPGGTETVSTPVRIRV